MSTSDQILSLLVPSCTHMLAWDLALLSTESNFVFTNPELKLKYTNFQWSGGSTENNFYTVLHVFQIYAMQREYTDLCGFSLSFR